MNSIPLIRSLLLVCLLPVLAGTAQLRAQQSLIATWDPSPDSSVTGYSLYYGVMNGSGTNKLTVGNTSSATISSVLPDNTYFVYVTAFNAAGEESVPSNVVNYTTKTGPMLASIADQAVQESHLLSFLLAATDADLNPVLTYHLVSGPSGATVDAVSGLFSWTPTEAQGPSSNPITVQVTDNRVPPLSDTKSFTVTVAEVNSAPVLQAISDQTIAEGSTLSVKLIGTDSDVPANALTYTLVSGPAGATVDGASGVLSWTPTEAQGPSSVSFTVRVTDNGSPALSDTHMFTVTVTEVNSAPVLNPVADQKVNAGQALMFSLSATDPDLPANKLTYRLNFGPAGVSVDPNTGVFTWRVSKSHVGGVYAVSVGVTDDGFPALTDSKTFNVTVNAKRNAQLLGEEAGEGVLRWVAELSSSRSLNFKQAFNGGHPLGSGASYLEVSEDLVQWIRLGPISEAVEVRDRAAAGAAQRFYRVITESIPPGDFSGINSQK